MAFVFVGIDENGYGPKLGPLIVTSVGVRSELDNTPLVLRVNISHKNIRGLLIDSKQVFKARRYSKGELLALALIKVFKGRYPETFFDLLDMLSLGSSPRASCKFKDLRCMYDFKLPAWSNSKPDKLAEDIASDLRAIRFFPFALKALFICPWNFNHKIKLYGSKVRLNFEAFKSHWTWYLSQIDKTDKLKVFCDKLSGVKRYGSYLRGKYMFSTREESGNLSFYSLRTYNRGLSFELSFIKKGDEQVWLISASSIVGKYIRELSMVAISKFLSDYFGEKIRFSGYYDTYSMEVIRRLKKEERFPLPLLCMIRER